MKTKKPDIFLGIVICMLVLTAVLCIVILFVQKSGSEPAETGTPQISNTETNNPGESNQPDPSGTGIVDPSNNPEPSEAPVTLEKIDEPGLKAALNDSLRGLTSEWQVVVIDPYDNTRIGSSINCGVDDWMTANRMTQVFIMGTVFQQAADGTLVLDEWLDDVKAMITGNDTYAADRLTEKLGGGDAAKGRENVKAFAVANGVKLGFNRANTGSSSLKNYVTAQQTAAILNLICRGELVSEEASAQMLEILLTPMDNLEISTGLTGENVRFGFIADVETNTCVCAMGVVQLQNRSFVISVVCNKPVTTDGAKKKVTELISLTQPFFEN